MANDRIKVGDVWRLTHSRKGDLTMRFTGVDDEWTTGEIIEGRVRYMSEENRFAQRAEGRGTPGDTITMRISFLTLHEKLAVSE